MIDCVELLKRSKQENQQLKAELKEVKAALFKYAKCTNTDCPLIPPHSKNVCEQALKPVTNSQEIK